MRFNSNFNAFIIILRLILNRKICTVKLDI